MLQGSLKIILQNLAVEVLIHLPINLHKYPTPSQVIQPHIMMEPPPNLRVVFTVLSLKHSLGFFHTHFRPSEPNLLILDSSDHISLFQSATVQSLWAIAKSSLSLL